MIKLKNPFSGLKDPFTDLPEVPMPKVPNFEHLKLDNVNHPPHYKQGKIETIDVITDITKQLPGDQGYLVGNIIKYVSRYQYKNGVEDLKKAKWYLNRLIEENEKAGR